MVMVESFIQRLRQRWLKKRTKAGLMPWLAVAVTLLLLLVLKLTQPAPPVKHQAEKTWAVQTRTLTGETQQPQLKLYGRVESPFTATLTASIAADVKNLPVREGQQVLAGQLLLELDDADVQLAVKENRANVAELQALIESENNRYKNDLAALKLEKSLVALAEKKLAREKKTSQSNLTSQSSLDTQKQALQQQQLSLKSRQLSVANHPARLAQLQAKLQRSQALAEQAENDAGRAKIVAPYDAIILATEAAPGERVRPGETLLKLYALNQVELRAQVPQKFVATIKQALAQQQALHASADTANGSIDVSLNRLAGSMAQDNSGVDALFSVAAGQAGQLIIGETLSLTLSLPALDNVFSVPVASIYGTNRLYRVNDGRLEAVTVVIKGKQYHAGKQFVLVQSEQLQRGDEVITTQLPYAVNGLKVAIKKAGESPATGGQAQGSNIE
ncbi:MAG TPA: HlyD family efflux transporter periplasmic adaptor subunit [Thiotrichales bacterium]|nr:HlyD family efflux transporter periplasmic adaptor subunit [Thiotrichales bacterium]